MLAVLPGPLVSLLVILNGNMLDVSDRVAVVGHLHQDAVTQLDKTPHTDVPIDLGVLGIWLVDYVLSLEVGPVVVEPVGYEDGNVVHPSVPGLSLIHISEPTRQAEISY